MKETLPSYEAMMPAIFLVLADSAACFLCEVFERICLRMLYPRAAG